MAVNNTQPTDSNRYSVPLEMMSYFVFHCGNFPCPSCSRKHLLPGRTVNPTHPFYVSVTAELNALMKKTGETVYAVGDLNTSACNMKTGSVHSHVIALPIHQ